MDGWHVLLLPTYPPTDHEEVYISKSTVFSLYSAREYICTNIHSQQQQNNKTYDLVPLCGWVVLSIVASVEFYNRATQRKLC